MKSKHISCTNQEPSLTVTVKLSLFADLGLFANDALEADWLRLRQHHEYENPWFYVSQLYEEDWRPSPMLI